MKSFLKVYIFVILKIFYKKRLVLFKMKAVYKIFPNNFRNTILAKINIFITLYNRNSF